MRLRPMTPLGSLQRFLDPLAGVEGARLSRLLQEPPYLAPQPGWLRLRNTRETHSYAHTQNV